MTKVKREREKNSFFFFINLKRIFFTLKLIFLFIEKVNFLRRHPPPPPLSSIFHSSSSSLFLLRVSPPPPPSASSFFLPFWIFKKSFFFYKFLFLCNCMSNKWSLSSASITILFTSKLFMLICQKIFFFLKVLSFKLVEGNEGKTCRRKIVRLKIFTMGKTYSLRVPRDFWVSHSLKNYWDHATLEPFIYSWGPKGGRT